MPSTKQELKFTVYSRNLYHCYLDYFIEDNRHDSLLRDYVVTYDIELKGWIATLALAETDNGDYGEPVEITDSLLLGQLVSCAIAYDKANPIP